MAAVCMAAAASLVGSGVRAEQWTLESNLQTSLELNDNAALVVSPSGVTRTLSLSNSLLVARNTESTSTKLDAVLTGLDQRGGDASNRVDGRLGFNHSLTLPRGAVNLGGSVAQDFNSDVLSADVTVGRGQRRTLGLSASASYALSERLTANLQGSFSRAGYGKEVTQAVDFRNNSLAASASYLLSETETVALQATRASYRTLSGSTRSSTDSVDVSYTRSLSERANASLSLGAFQEDTTRTFFSLACPLPVSFCLSGLVPYVTVPVTVKSPRSSVDPGASLSYRLDDVSGLSASLGRRKSAASFTRQFSERDSLAVSLARQFGPSGVGTEVRSQNLSITTVHGLTPTLNANMSWAQARASTDDGVGPRREPRQTSLAATLIKEFSRDASLQAGWRRTQSQGLFAGASASANSVNIALRLTWARLEAAR